MKKMKRRLLSLLLAAVMVCTLAPVGFMEEDGVTGGDGNHTVGQETASAHTKNTATHTIVNGSDCTQNNVKFVYSCSASGCSGTFTEAQSTNGTHQLGSYSATNNKHSATCTVCNQTVRGDCVAGPDGKCTVCKEALTLTGITLSESKLSLAVGETWTLKATAVPAGAAMSATFTSSAPTIVSTTADGKLTALSAGTATITAKSGAVESLACTVTVGNALTIRANSNYIGSNDTFTSMDHYITLTALLNGKEVDTSIYDVEWMIDGSDPTYFAVSGRWNDSSVTIVPDGTSTTRRSCVVTVTVSSGKTVVGEKSYTLYLQMDRGISLTATVNDDYYFSDVSNKGTYSVAEQLENALYSLYGYTRTLDYVIFDNVTTNYGDLDNITVRTKVYAEDFGNIKFVPTAKGNAVFTFTAYARTNSYYSADAYTGVLTITVSDEVTSSGGDIIIYGSIGEDVYMDSAKFEDFWDTKYPGGVLNYVSFGGVSGGSLLDVDGKSAGTNRYFYVNARSSQYALGDVHFRPNSTNASKAVTLTLSFNAYGENKSGTEKVSTGTVSIVYMSKNPSNIVYTVGSNGKVSLKASDFTAAYREATGSNAPTNLTIVFQNVPSKGSLTYTDSSKQNSTTVNLTSSGIRSRKFSTSGSGTNQISDVMYTSNGAGGTDTIEYIAYTGSTVKYKGSIVFNGETVPTDIVVTYTSANGASVDFSWSDFTSKDSALSNAVNVRFTAPANGTLYLDGAAISASKDVLVTQVSGIKYVPKTGTNTQEKLAFVATDKNNKTVGSGTVVININGSTTTTTPPASNGASSAREFTDVKATDWFYADLDTLVRMGIMSGRGNGVFDPNGTMTYGEALKLILEATGHSAVATTGNEWAINYKNLAVQNGWISDSIVLTAPISRLATADLIARVLGLSKYTGESPFADTTDGYAAALYYTNPQIFMGNPNSSGGKPLFNPLVKNVPQTTLTRAQVCALICRLNTYHQGGGQSSVSAPSTPSKPNTPSNPSNVDSNTGLEMDPNTGLPVGV